MNVFENEGLTLDLSSNVFDDYVDCAYLFDFSVEEYILNRFIPLVKGLVDRFSGMYIPSYSVRVLDAHGRIDNGVYVYSDKNKLNLVSSWLDKYAGLYDVLLVNVCNASSDGESSLILPSYDSTVIYPVSKSEISLLEKQIENPDLNWFHLSKSKSILAFEKEIEDMYSQFNS